MSLTDGHRAVVGNGYLPARDPHHGGSGGSAGAQGAGSLRLRRQIQLGVGPAVRAPQCAGRRGAAVALSSGDLGEALEVRGERSGSPPMAPRRGSPSAMGCATSRYVVCRRIRAWPSATGLWDFGVYSIRSIPKPCLSVAGSTRCGNVLNALHKRCTARRRRICRRSGWHRPTNRPRTPSRASSTAMRPNTPRPPRSSRSNARPCSPSSPSRQSTGCTCSLPTRSSRTSPPHQELRHPRDIPGPGLQNERRGRQDLAKRPCPRESGRAALWSTPQRRDAGT